MKVLLAVLIGTLEFTKVQGWEVQKYSLITMRPKNGLYLHIRRINTEEVAEVGELGVGEKVGRGKRVMGNQSDGARDGTVQETATPGMSTESSSVYGSWIDIGDTGSTAGR